MDIFNFQTQWDYQLLDSGAGFRLEQWGPYRLSRPDPQSIWQPTLPVVEWDKADAKFQNKNWITSRPLPDSWEVCWKNLKLSARLTPFKHTGIFPEQAANWEWLSDRILNPEARISDKSKTKIQNSRFKILNLFGYTGASSVLLAKSGCFVTHVDASKPAISWAKENQQINGLAPDSIRWILDDASKFVKREIKRGAKYDGILMDPPAFGHSPQGKVWKFAEDFPRLLADCRELMSNDFRFFLINAYATNTSAIALQNVFEDNIKPHNSSQILCGELCLKQQTGRLLSTGITLRLKTSS